MRQGFCHLSGKEGATSWLAPGVESQFGLWTQIQFALGQARFGSKGAMKRAMHLGALMSEYHPSEPHLYLFTIGTTEAARNVISGNDLSGIAVVNGAADTTIQGNYIGTNAAGDAANDGFNGVECF